MRFKKIILNFLLFLNLTTNSFAETNYEGAYVGFGVESINATIQRQEMEPPLVIHKFNGNTLEFHIGYNKELKDYGLNGFVTGLELSYNNDFFGEIKDQYSCSNGDYICRSKINYSYQAKIKVGYKYDNFLPNLFIRKV